MAYTYDPNLRKTAEGAEQRGGSGLSWSSPEQRQEYLAYLARENAALGRQGDEYGVSEYLNWVAPDTGSRWTFFRDRALPWFAAALGGAGAQSALAGKGAAGGGASAASASPSSLTTLGAGSAYDPAVAAATLTGDAGAAAAGGSGSWLGSALQAGGLMGSSGGNKGGSSGSPSLPAELRPIINLLTQAGGAAAQGATVGNPFQTLGPTYAGGIEAALLSSLLPSLTGMTGSQAQPYMPQDLSTLLFPNGVNPYSNPASGSTGAAGRTRPW